MTTKLGKYIKILQGYAFKSKNYVKKSEYRLVTLGNFEEKGNCFKYNDDKATYYGSDFPQKVILQEGDLILPLTEQVVGLFGNSAFIPHGEGFKFILNQRVGKIILLNNQIDKYYLHYLLATKEVKKQLEARANGTKQRNISPDDVYDVSVELPDIEKQRKIGNLFYKIEKKQEYNNKINIELESLAKTVYDYWFLQFEFPNAEGKPYKSSGGKMVYNEQLKKEIPEGWEVKRIKDVCKCCLGGTPSTKNKEYWNGGIPWLNSGEISNFPIVESAETISQLGLDNSATEYMKEGTVVVSITGNIRASFLGFDSCANQSVVGLYENDHIKKEYLYPVLANMVNRYISISGGNCQKHINKAEIENTFIIIPDESILNDYYNKTNSIYLKIVTCAKENLELTSLRDFLLPLLMNGQVTIKDTEEKIGEVVKTNDGTFDKEKQFELWLQNQGLAARGDVDFETLREIFNAMDENDK